MRKKYYLTLDTETATLPFANEICKNAKEKQKIAIAKPLVYDIGWTITDTKGEVQKARNFLVQETFFVPNVFNTAYYKDKRPLYMELLAQGKIDTGKWDDIIPVLIDDLEFCDLTAAYNACFDFKKAIPFTERYIKNLYSVHYTEWEIQQRAKCEKILAGNDDSNNPDYLKPVFELRGREYPIVDLWGLSCERLINSDRYRDYCLKNGYLTASAQYFKSSAETCFQYIMRQHDFIEEHTALSDAEIEAQILAKALKKGKIVPNIKAFPFRDLGNAYEYVVAQKPQYTNVLKAALEKYIAENDGYERAMDDAAYWKKIVRMFENL